MVFNREENLKHLRSLTNILDTRFKGPLGTRYGIDGLVGLIPGVGDFFTTALSLYIIAQASLLGVSSATLIRMSFNVLVENLVDMIPFAGNIFDFYWKANVKNMALIERHLANPARETIRSRMVVGLICIILLVILIASAYLSFLVLKAIFHWISSRID